ncbi:ABC transporter ATP-binding protein [Streptomyces sannanensis]|uniref:ABC transporter ATP-binding protein n=1 Tax=Streptomyces sannanensis TaxID=285536 RepID=A0ABP6SGT4_9ACTN
MLQAIGLTSAPRRFLPPTVDDLSFEARPGCVTALLGAPGSGKTTTLRLMLELETGRGVTYFRGRPLHQVAHPAREVGALLGDVPGHPARTVRNQLRMLCAAVGVPVSRADAMLERVGLAGVRDERLGTLPLGMDRRLGLACALLGDPHTLLLDEPARRLSPRESGWLYELLRSHAEQGGTVLCTVSDAKEAARTADHVIAIDGGRLVADQGAADFTRTRLRPCVAVRTPHAARLAALLSREARTGRRSMEVVAESGSRLYIYGSSCGEIGEAAFRHGVLLHQLADEIPDLSPPRRLGDPRPAPGPEVDRADAARPDAPAAAATDGASLDAGPHGFVDADPEAAACGPAEVLTGTGQPAPGTGTAVPAQTGGDGAPGSGESAAGAPYDGDAGLDAPEGAGAADTTPDAERRAARVRAVDGAGTGVPVGDGRHTGSPVRGGVKASGVSPMIRRRTLHGPLRPYRYELHRLLGVRTTGLIVAAVLVGSAVIAVLLARDARTVLPGLLAAWPGWLPLPPAALGAGLLGALAFGEEFRYPALGVDRGTVPRRLGLLLAKLVVAAGAALLLGALTVAADWELIRLLYGADLAHLPADLASKAASWAGLTVGCAWAGLLGAAVFRATTAGVAAVLAVPVVVAPLVREVLEAPLAPSALALAARLRGLAWVRWPQEADRWLAAAVRLVAQPVGAALVLSLLALLCAYLVIILRAKARW